MYSLSRLPIRTGSGRFMSAGSYLTGTADGLTSWSSARASSRRMRPAGTREPAPNGRGASSANTGFAQSVSITADTPAMKLLRVTSLMSGFMLVVYQISAAGVIVSMQKI